MAEKTKKTTKKTTKPKSKAVKTVKTEVKEYDVAARAAKVKAIENPVVDVELTTLQEIQVLSNKRNKLSGKLMGGDRVPDKENIAKEVDVLSKKIAELKIKKVEEDARGR